MRSISRLLSVLLCLVLSLSEQAVNGGYVVVMADTTPLYPLIYDSYEGFEGNRQFFRNLAGDNGSVLVRRPAYNAPAVRFFQAEGTPVGTTREELTAEALQGVTLVISADVITPFTAAEQQLLRSYVSNGGNLFLGVEHRFHPDAEVVRSVTHALLRSMRIDVVVTNPTFDNGTRPAVGDQIADHPLTQDVSTFVYGHATHVRGGEPLFISTTGYPFATATFVPEPAAVTIVCSALLALATLRRQRYFRWSPQAHAEEFSGVHSEFASV